MKKSEIQALKEAFNIPEPENKNDFIRIYEVSFKKNKRRFYPIMIFRYASAAVMAAVVICLCGLAGKNSDFNSKFNNVSIIKESDSDSYSNASCNTTAVSTDAMSTENLSESLVTESVTISSEMNTATTALTSQNIEIGDEPIDVPVYEMPEKTSESATDAVTTVSYESSTTNSASITTATTAVTEPPTVTTSKEQDINKYPVTDGPDDISDLTVIPSVKYDKPNDSVYHIYGDVTNGADDIDDFDGVIIASVDEVIYTEINGEPYTQENITIISSLQGDIKLNYMDKISVFIKGGYMPADKFAENHSWINIPPEYRYVYYSKKQIPEQQVGKNYIFFLKKSNLIPEESTFDIIAVQ
ncbi:MAG: hypothetical protein NC042_08450 [Ruminococcus flavefaciens]|nr:hypothetical protein [Ruminococcus flavefaciens]